MEIIFELEDSDIECVFEPDFALPLNCCDFEKITWTLQNGTHTRTVASLFDSTSEHEYPTAHILPIV